MCWCSLITFTFRWQSGANFICKHLANPITFSTQFSNSLIIHRIYKQRKSLSWFYFSVASLGLLSIKEIYQKLKTVFDHTSKHLTVHQKYFPVHCIFNSLLVEHQMSKCPFVHLLHTCFLILVPALLHLKIMMVIPQQCWTLAEKKTTNQLLLYLEEETVQVLNA